MEPSFEGLADDINELSFCTLRKIGIHRVIVVNAGRHLEKDCCKSEAQCI